MLFNYSSGLKDTFIRQGSYLPGQIAKTGWKQAPALNTLATEPNIEFGQAVKRAVNDNNLPYATAIESGDAATDLYGIAVRDVVSQSSVTYGANGTSFIYSFANGQPVTILRKGWIAIPVQNGTPTVGGTVYMRVTASDTNANLPIGGFETAADDGKCVAIPATFESVALFPMNGVSTAPTADVATSQTAVIYLDLD